MSKFCPIYTALEAVRYYLLRNAHPKEYWPDFKMHSNGPLVRLLVTEHSRQTPHVVHSLLGNSVIRG